MGGRLGLATALGFALVACGGAPVAPTEVVLARPSASVAEAPQAPPTPRRGPSAVEVVRASGASIWAVVEVALLRDHALAKRLDPILPFRQSLAAAGIDPKTDIDRLLLADDSLTHHRNATAIWEHHIDPARIDAFLTEAIHESSPEGRRFDADEHACAVLFRRGLVGTACVASPTLLLVMVKPTGAELFALSRSSGIGPPPAGELAHVTVLNPSRTLAMGDLRPPAGLGTLDLRVRASSPGGLDIELRAPSDDPARDAAAFQALLQSPDAAIRLGPLPLPPPPIQFVAKGGDVVGTMAVTKDDLDALTSLLTLALPF